MQIKVVKTFEHELPTPKQQSNFSAGFDLQNAGEDFVLSFNKRTIVSTGFAFAIPSRHAGFIWPRSGLAAKHGVEVLAGLIDADYRGEIKVILFGTDTKPLEIKHGDRIAQLVIQPVIHAETVLKGKLDSTPRGLGGFGSTGK